MCNILQEGALLMLYHGSLLIFPQLLISISLDEEATSLSESASPYLLGTHLENITTLCFLSESSYIWLRVPCLQEYTRCPKSVCLGGTCSSLESHKAPHSLVQSILTEPLVFGITQHLAALAALLLPAQARSMANTSPFLSPPREECILSLLTSWQHFRLIFSPTTS